MAGQSRKGKWRDRTIEKLNRAESPTVFQGQEDIQSGVSPSDQPQFDVFEVRLKGKDDQPIIISGNTLNIELQTSLLKAVDQLLEIRGLGGGASVMSGGIIKRRGQPQILLWFKEAREDVDPEFSQVYGRISFRVMDKTDDPDIDLEKISWADIEKLAKKIKELFYGITKTSEGKVKNYTWKKGKEQVVYHDWKNGYQLQLLCRNKSDGIELIQKIVQIQSHSYAPKWVKHSTPEDPMASYPTIPEVINVLGENVRRDRLRPIADVQFHHAELLLTNWKQPIILVNPNGDILPNRP